MPSRNLIICCDGTNNEFGSQNTNVIRLVQVLNRDPLKQSIFYNPGVGTMPEPGWFAWGGKFISKLFGLAFGAGLAADVQKAYSFLMEEWKPGDKVFLYGFSRGAYTIRVLAAFLHQMGLLPPRSSNMVPYAFRLFEAIRKAGDGNVVPGSYWDLCNQFRETFAQPTTQSGRHFPVEFVGAWDTVSSYGWVWNPATFPFTQNNPSIRIIRHAVSIDEHRAFFRTNLYLRKFKNESISPLEPIANQDIKELWFPGVHADVGGGYPAESSGLWRGPFEWIVRESEGKGVFIDADRLKKFLSNPPAKPQPYNDEAHQSLTWKWWPAEFMPKLQKKSFLPKINFFKHRTLLNGFAIHQDALHRIRERSDYRPKNLSSAFIQKVLALKSVPDSIAYEE